MRRGICRLCLAEADLCDSHYLGRRLYALLRTDGEQPVRMSPSRIIRTDQQIKDYLLCAECERRFNDRGERYATTMVNQFGNFKLLDLIRSAPRRRVEGEFTVYCALDIGVDTESLAYYALSVIWRGGVHTWRTSKVTATGGISLGAHEEPIRKYLCGLGPFPPGVFVKLSVATDFASQNSVKFPEVSPDQPDTTVFTFHALGIWFDVIIGENLPQYMLRSCCVSSEERLIFVGDFDRYVVYDGQQMRQSARISGRLRQPLQTQFEERTN